MYKNRYHAGQMLADLVERDCFGPCLILAVPRGGVVVAEPVAAKLKRPLELLITRKLGHPQNEEVAIGAVMPDGSAIYDEVMVKSLGLTNEFLAEQVAKEYRELQRRLVLYKGTDYVAGIRGKTAVIIDDGIATGYTIKAAVKWLQKLEPAGIVVAVPVAPPDIVADLSLLVDNVICPLQPDHFMAVGMYYKDFSQIDDEEVIAIMERCNGEKQIK